MFSLFPQNPSPTILYTQVNVVCSRRVAIQFNTHFSGYRQPKLLTLKITLNESHKIKMLVHDWFLFSQSAKLTW